MPVSHPSLAAPLDYRYALDAAMSLCGASTWPTVVCNVPQLVAEIDYRRAGRDASASATVAIWIEPMVQGWRAELATLSQQVQAGGTLVVIASLPLARILPERRTWGGDPLTMHPGGLRQLSRALARAGFRLTSRHGIHTPAAIGLNLLSRQLEARGCPDLGDRLQFAARLRYATDGPLASLSTVALLVVEKER